MIGYIHALPDWPRFRWDREALEQRLLAVHHSQGRLLGRMEAVGFTSRAEAFLGTITEDVLKSSEIEGEILDRDQVRSSVARHLGMEIGGAAKADRTVDGVVEMILDATHNYALPLTQERLFQWHRLLFPTTVHRLGSIRIGEWRDDAKGPMQVISGPYGRERVHFEAPAADRVEREMAVFLDWFNDEVSTDWVMKAGIAHLWFVTIHPFEDGNGRIARALTDMALAQDEREPRRFYSLSSQIMAEREAYYDILERTQKGDGDITAWLVWFLGCMNRAMESSERLLGTVLAKGEFWRRHADVSLSERQRKVLNRLLDVGTEGFKGGLTTRKYTSLAGVSRATAFREIAQLLEWGMIRQNPGGGRSVSYDVAWPAQEERR